LVINAKGEAAGSKSRDFVEVGISSMDFGDGRLSGELILDSACLGMKTNISRPFCAQLGMVAATAMHEMPFEAMPQDGIVGLGLQALSVSPLFNFVDHLKESGSLAPIFGVFLADSDDEHSEISFGGHSPERLQSELMWAAVANKAETAKLLEAKGGAEKTNNEGLTAAAIAQKMGHKIW